MPSRLPEHPRRQPWWRRAVRGTAEIVAALVIAPVAVAVADAATTSTNLRLAVAIPIIVGAVYAEWGVRVAVHKARRRNLSSNSQTHNLSKRRLTRRFRRG